MQKLALMMAVMILGMSPAHGCSIGTDLGSPGVGGPAEVMSLLPTWFSSGGKTLMAKDTISSAAAGGNRPVEPGERLVGRCNVSPSPTDVSPTENSWMLHPLDKVSLGYFAPDRTIPSL